MFKQASYKKYRETVRENLYPHVLYPPPQSPVVLSESRRKMVTSFTGSTPEIYADITVCKEAKTDEIFQRNN